MKKKSNSNIWDLLIRIGYIYCFTVVILGATYGIESFYFL